MKEKINRIPAWGLTLILSGIGYFLRRHQLATGLDAAGKFLPGAGNCFFTWFTVAIVLAFAVYAWCLPKRKNFTQIQNEHRLCVISAILAAGCIGLGSGAMFVKPLLQGDSYLAVFGFVAALCWLAAALFQARSRTPHWALYLLPVLFFAAKLIVDFRVWSRDPAILDYCYDLFALICTMCATLHIGGFVFDKGQRRIAVFFTMAGIFFQSTAMAGASNRELAITTGVMLYLGLHLWNLLRQTEEEPEEVEEAAEET